MEYKETMFEDSHKMLGRRIPVDRVIADPTEDKNEAEPLCSSQMSGSRTPSFRNWLIGSPRIRQLKELTPT